MVLPPFFHSFHRLAGAGLLLFALVFLVAAALAPDAVVRRLPFLAGLGFNTAFCIGLIGLVLAAEREDHSPHWMVVHAVVATLAITTLLQYALGLYPPDGPWRMLLNTTRSAGTWPGRMSVASASILVLFSAAGWLLTSRQKRLAPAVYLVVGLGSLIALGGLASHLVGLVLFAHARPEAGYMSPASSLPLILAGAAAWQAAGRRAWMRDWRVQAPGVDLFVQAAGLLAALLVLGGVLAGGLMLEGRYRLAAAIILVLAPAGAAWLYWRIVPVVERIQRAESDLRVTSKQQELFLSHAGQGICGLDGAGRISFANPAAASLLAYDATELIGRSMHCLVHDRRHDGSSYPEAECPILNTLQDGISRHVENEAFWDGDGGLIEVEYDVAALREDKSIIGAVVLFSDISERKLAEKALLANESQLRAERDFVSAVVETAGNVIAVLDQQGRIVRFNRAAEMLTGYSFEELHGKPVWEYLIPPERQADVRDVFDRLMHDKFGGAHENEWLMKDGSRRLLDWHNTVLRDNNGQISHVVALGYDITEQKTRENELRRSEATLAQAQAQANLGSWWLDIPRNVLRWSDENYRIFGVPIGTPLTYETFLGCIHPDDRAYVDVQWHAGMGGGPYDIQHRLLVDGQVKWVRERAELEFHADGTLWRGVGTTQDITELKLKEEALLHSRQMLRELAAHHEKIREEERSRIAREVHDELGQYLTALRMDAAVLGIRFGKLDPELDLLALGMKETIDTTIGVVRNVAAALRPGALDMGLVSAAEWLLASFEERTGILCHLEAPQDQLGLDDARATAAFRILQESLTNVARHAQANEVQITLARTDHKLSMQIRDDGVGFDPDLEAQRKTFGLMGIRERALMFGGEARIDSRPGTGTSLNVLIPLEDGPSASPPDIGTS